MTQSLIDNQQMQIYSLKSQLTKATELIDLLNQEALSRIGVITHLETKLGKAEELIGKLESALKISALGETQFDGVEAMHSARQALEEIAKWRKE